MCSSVQNVICSLMMKKDLKDILIHTKRELKGRKQKESRLPDFDKPDFSQVM